MADTSKAKILPCPFCGNDGSGPIEDALHVVFIECDFRGPSWSAQCDKCTATMGYSDSEDEAVEAWNRRTAQAEVARLTAALAAAGELEAAIRAEIKAPKDWPTIYAVKAVHRALAEAETRGAERMREAAADEAEQCAMEWREDAEEAAKAETKLYFENRASAAEWVSGKIRALPLPPRERDGQEG